MSDKLSIEPVYSKKEGRFLGYAVKENGRFVRDENKKPVIISDEQTPAVIHAKFEECAHGIRPAASAPNGIYANSPHSYSVHGYWVKYGTKQWHVPFKKYEQHVEPKKTFIPEIENGVFKGYRVKQYDHEAKKVVERDMVDASQLRYKKMKDGKYQCYFVDKMYDGTLRKYIIETITEKELKNRGAIDQVGAMNIPGENISTSDPYAGYVDYQSPIISAHYQNTTKAK